MINTEGFPKKVTLEDVHNVVDGDNVVLQCPRVFIVR